MKDIPADVREKATEIAIRYSGYANTPLVELIVPALLAERREAEQRGAERMRRLYAIAEHADWYGWRPRRFWRWLLAYYDKRAGYYGPLTNQPPDARDPTTGPQP